MEKRMKMKMTTMMRHQQSANQGRDQGRRLAGQGQSSHQSASNSSSEELMSNTVHTREYQRILYLVHVNLELMVKANLTIKEMDPISVISGDRCFLLP